MEVDIDHAIDGTTLQVFWRAGRAPLGGFREVGIERGASVYQGVVYHVVCASQASDLLCSAPIVKHWTELHEAIECAHVELEPNLDIFEHPRTIRATISVGRAETASVDFGNVTLAEEFAGVTRMIAKGIRVHYDRTPRQKIFSLEYLSVLDAVEIPSALYEAADVMRAALRETLKAIA